MGSGAHQVPNGKKHSEPATLPSPHALEKAKLRRGRQEARSPLLALPPAPPLRPAWHQARRLAPGHYSKARRPFVLGIRRLGEKPTERPGILWPFAGLEAADNCGMSLGRWLVVRGSGLRIVIWLVLPGPCQLPDSIAVRISTGLRSNPLS